MSEMAKNYVDWNNKWNYPLQWIYESEWARRAYQLLIYRVDLAMEGRPYSNVYQEEIKSLMTKLTPSEREKLSPSCINPPEGESFVVAQSVNTVANQMATGVDSYNYKINDSRLMVNSDTEALLSAKCEEDYIENRLELMSPLFSKDLQRYGAVGVLVNYDPRTDSNIVSRVHPKDLWFDTMFNALGKQRFIGYSTMISWSKLKKMIKDSKDDINYTNEAPSESIFDGDKLVKKATFSKKKIRTLNDFDIYVSDMNRLAGAADLQGFPEYLYPYQHDLDTCYNLNYYRSFANDPKAKTKNGYNGQDVELTVIYDLDRKIEFKIINRRFVISMNKKVFRRNILFNIYNPLTDQVNYRVDEVMLDCPLKVQFAEFDTLDKFPHPVSQVMRSLPLHNELCAWRAKRSHVAKILSILRIETNGADADSLRKLLNVMGIVLDDIQGDISSINFAYDWTAIDSQIAYIEDTIKKNLCAYSEFDALQMMGDRASAAESGMAIGAISQGLASHQNIIMYLYADIARQCLMNRVIYSPRQEFSVNNLGNYSEITAQQMALNAIITAKPKLAKRVYERTLAANAMALLPQLAEVFNNEGKAYLITKALYDIADPRMVESFMTEPGVSPQETALATQQAQNQAQMLLQNQQAYQNDPIPYEVDNVAENFTAEEMAQITNGINNATAEVEGSTDITTLDMPEQDGAMALNLEGMTSDLGSALANPNGNV